MSNSSGMYAEGPLGMGVLGGNLASGDALSELQNNLRFRVNSARDMLMGKSQLSPGQRRREIMDQNMNVVNALTRGSSSSSPSSSSTGSSSGRISSNGSGGSTSSSSKSSTPSMSEVNVGTKARAEERGFGG